MAGVSRGPTTSVASSRLDTGKIADSAKITGAEDYDKMMKMYEDLAAQAKAQAAADANEKIKYTPIAPSYAGGAAQMTPSLLQWSQGNDMTSALQQFANASQSGGYSPEDLQNIRARGISPIRSIYANAQRGIEHDRTLQGGYSPNFNAASVKMAREMSEQLASASTAVEADIADRVAKGKATSLSGYAQLATESDRSRNAADSQNASSVNNANQFNASAVNTVNAQNAAAQASANALNASMPVDYANANNTTKNSTNNLGLGAVNGMVNLYGTTPANASLYGAQDVQKQQMAQQAAQAAAQLKAQQLADASRTAASIYNSGQRSHG